MGRLLARVIAAQDRWARPLGDFNHGWLGALLRPIRPVKDFLSGVWLGHPLHAAVTDIPIGTLLVVVVLDVLGQSAAADIALVATVLFMLAAAVTGAGLPSRRPRGLSPRTPLTFQPRVRLDCAAPRLGILEAWVRVTHRRAP